MLARPNTIGMKKLRKGRKLGRKRDQRRALLKQLASSLILEERITTTEAKAKEVRPFVERTITYSKKADKLHARRLVGKYYTDIVAVKLMNEIGPRYKDRSGGYTRIVKLPARTRDSARMAIIELVK